MFATWLAYDGMHTPQMYAWSAGEARARRRLIRRWVAQRRLCEWGEQQKQPMLSHQMGSHVTGRNKAKGAK